MQHHPDLPEHDGCPCCVAPAAGPRGLSRRRLLTGLALGAGLVALNRVDPVRASTGARVDELRDPASALQPAQRITTTTSTTGVPTTTTATDLPTTTGEPVEGEILFPIEIDEALLNPPNEVVGVLNNFGDTRGSTTGYYHKGVDIMAVPGGHGLRAVCDGVLTRWYSIDADGFCGWRLYDDVNDVMYKYFHAQDDQNGWSEGDRVSQGDIIGFVGDTGNDPGNFHLHFEYWPDYESSSYPAPRDAYPLLQRDPLALFWG